MSYENLPINIITLDAGIHRARAKAIFALIPLLPEYGKDENASQARCPVYISQEGSEVLGPSSNYTYHG